MTHPLREAVEEIREPDAPHVLRRRSKLRPLPIGWKFYFAADTGTYMSGAFVAFPPDSLDAYVLETFANYRYVGGVIELNGESIPEWSRRVIAAWKEYVPGKTKLKGLVDQNTQFKFELQHYDIHLHGNPVELELRVEITREYFANRRIHLAPWLDSVLAYELEHAAWPDDTNSAGKFQRLKEQDHTLDCIEHVCSQRPRNKKLTQRKAESFLDRHLREHGWRDRLGSRVDPHLGRI